MTRKPGLFTVFTAPLMVSLAVLVGGCGRETPVYRDESFVRSYGALFGPLFAPGTEIDEDRSCGLGDCDQLAPWLSPDFLACQAGPGGTYALEAIACYGGEHERQMAALRRAEQQLLARLPAAESAGLRAAQVAWMKAEPAVMRSCLSGLEGPLMRMQAVACQLNYSVRRRIDLEERLGRSPGPPAA